MAVVQGSSLHIKEHVLYKQELKQSFHHLNSVITYGVYRLSTYKTPEGKTQLLIQSKITAILNFFRDYFSLLLNSDRKNLNRQRINKLQKFLAKDYNKICQAVQHVINFPMHDEKITKVVIKSYPLLKDWRTLMKQPNNRFFTQINSCFAQVWKQEHLPSKAEMKQLSQARKEAPLERSLYKYSQTRQTDQVIEWIKVNFKQLESLPRILQKIQIYSNQLPRTEQAQIDFALAEGYLEIKQTEKALRFMNLAAEKGAIKAQEWLADHYLEEGFYPQSNEKAIYWLEKIFCQQQDGQVAYTVACLYQQLNNNTKALEFIQLSASQNYQPAIQVLEKFGLNKNSVPHFAIPVNKAYISALRQKQVQQKVENTLSQPTLRTHEQEERRSKILVALEKRRTAQ